MPTEQLSLKHTWLNFKKEHPRIRIRDAAKQLNVTEASILAAFTGSSVLKLNNDFAGLLQYMPRLGYVMVLTRNEHCVHERKGVFEKVSVHDQTGLVLGAAIDLRLFLKNWAFAFAVFNDEEAGFKNSIQVFDHQGHAVIKIFLQPGSDAAAFETLTRQFSAAEQPTLLQLQPAAPQPVYKDATVDITLFRQDWAALKDTHDFFPLLKKHQVSRLHALKIAGDFTARLPNDTVVRLLQQASAHNWPIMVFVGNRGCIQIHTGTVNTLLPIPGWINVMDADFNLHLKLGSISETWLVQKPTTDGPVHSLELYDEQGELIVQFFGKRKPGQPEDQVWATGLRALAAAQVNAV
jgi:putative hemin transport protein